MPLASNSDRSCVSIVAIAPGTATLPVLLPPLAYLYGLFRLEKAGQAILVAGIGCLCLLFAF